MENIKVTVTTICGVKMVDNNRENHKYKIQIKYKALGHPTNEISFTNTEDTNPLNPAVSQKTEGGQIRVNLVAT